jgi:hypothetical protein
MNPKKQPQFTEAMYRKVGLTTHTQSPSVGAARKAPANLNEVRGYRVTNDHMDIDAQRRLAGLTEGDLNIPNPSGAIGLRPSTGEGVLDIESTLNTLGLPKTTPRLFESRMPSELSTERLGKRIRSLREEKRKLLSALRAVNERIQEAEIEKYAGKTLLREEGGAALGKGVEAARVRGGFVLIRERQDGTWVGLGRKKPVYRGTKEDVSSALEKDAQEKFTKLRDAVAAFEGYYKFSKPFMGNRVVV